MFKNKNGYFLIEEFLEYGVVAAFSSRKLGNMSDNVLEFSEINRNNFLKLLNLENKKIVHGFQKHTDKVVYIEEENNFDGVDGFITKDNNIVIFTYYADCLPIYILDKKQKAIGIAHSGWRGTYQNIISNLVNSMIEKFSSKKEDLLLALGIGISQEDYEVQEDFYNKFKDKYPNYLEECFLIKENKYYYDNTKLNYLLALENGILKENIIVDNRGVREANAFSYRINNDKLERSAAIISIKE